jgi:hypothetical protein
MQALNSFDAKTLAALTVARKRNRRLAALLKSCRSRPSTSSLSARRSHASSTSSWPNR